MQGNLFLFVFSVSFLILKLSIKSSLSCLLSKLNNYDLIDVSSKGNCFIYLLTSVNFLILLYLLLSLDGLVIMIFSKFFYYFPLVLGFCFTVAFCVLTVARQGANDFTEHFTVGLCPPLCMRK